MAYALPTGFNAWNGLDPNVPQVRQGALPTQAAPQTSGYMPPSVAASLKKAVQSRIPLDRNTEPVHDDLAAQKAQLLDQTNAVNKLDSSYKPRADLSAFLPILGQISGTDFASGYKAPQTQEDHDLMIQKLKQGLGDQQNKLTDRDLELKKAIENSKITAAMMAGDKEGIAKSKSQRLELGKVSQQLEQMRGNPAVQQAESDLYSAKKANKLIDMYPDPNKMSPQEINLYASEVGKIATGGVPTMHELEAIKPNGLPADFANTMQKFSNEPSAANAGAFLKRYQSYINNITEDAQGTIQDRYGRILDSRKRYIAPEDYADLKGQYLDRFTKGGGTPTSALSGSGPHGASVQQNGHTYNWNQSTGKYE